MRTNLSAYIRDDLRTRILAGTQLPPKLTLPALAELYRVSLMPVRIAIQELLEEDILQRQENGRLGVNPAKLGTRKLKSGAELPAPPADPYDAVLEDVINYSLRGEALELKIIPCAERYSVSRSQIHTIFHRLHSQGLLEHEPRRGWCVRPFKPADLDAYLDVREVLELLALDMARPHLEAPRLHALLELNAPLPERGPIQIDNSLHSYWVECSGNRYIADFFERHQRFYDMLLAHAVIRRPHVDLSRASHRRILEAMLAQDWPTAKAELSEDIRRLSSLLKQTVQRLEGAPLEDTPRVSVVKS